MRFLLLLILLSTYFFNASGQNEKTNKKELITMERGACFGSCPIFKITIFCDGKAIYEGERFVEKTGKYEKKLSKQEINNLIKQFRKADFYKFNENYPSRATDFPETIISFGYKGKYKKINHTNIVPDELVALEHLVDSIAEAKGWQKIEKTKN